MGFLSLAHIYIYIYIYLFLLSMDLFVVDEDAFPTRQPTTEPTVEPKPESTPEPPREPTRGIDRVWCARFRQCRQDGVLAWVRAGRCMGPYRPEPEFEPGTFQEDLAQALLNVFQA